LAGVIAGLRDECRAFADTNLDATVAERALAHDDEEVRRCAISYLQSMTKRGDAAPSLTHALHIGQSVRPWVGRSVTVRVVAAPTQAGPWPQPEVELGSGTARPSRTETEERR
jgi:hypothetical protein